jgi:hypothetical protein
MNGCVLCTDFLRRRSRRRSAGRGYGNRDRAPTEFRRRPVCLRLACLPGARQRKVTILVRVQGRGRDGRVREGMHSPARRQIRVFLAFSGRQVLPLYPTKFFPKRQKETGVFILWDDDRLFCRLI